ncbi:hypothetical protein [Halorussus salinus]|uniref:hypothetical protein n=1 Tax=Halorussus salinus TaxID=1364935 RepID=UPI001092D7E6|nr:hypothetical protein [Halorussus salinus]
MFETLTDGRGRRRALAVALVGLLVAFAGCAGLGGSDAATTENGTTAVEPTTGESTPTTDTAATTAANDSSATTDDGSETPADDSGTPATNESTTSSSGHSHGGEDHSHGGTDDSTANDSTANASAGSASADSSGKIAVAVAGSELSLDDRSSGDPLSIAADDDHTWRADSSVTLAAALGTFGIDANETALTYDGRTYRESTDGTEIYYRVSGEEVDPQSATLDDGDQVWVTVETADANYSVPGDYIRAAQLHVHGPMEFTVNGEEVDFSEERFQSGHRHFHFEGGQANPWHAHSWSVTLQYGLNTLSGINVTDDSVTYNGTTYERGPDTTVEFVVNGESVEPSEYFLKDGDDVRVVVQAEES